MELRIRWTEIPGAVSYGLRIVSLDGDVLLERTVFEPEMDTARRDELYAGWQRAVERSREWEV